ncbi:IclR family transcriptional regulator [Burkholderia pseudomultivorans]|uniref:Bacterial transcriptional regulator family protein n=2 Tax=Burkholderia cepacia complex TaxID=87882 RepID=A0AAN0VK13_9BURK|nr:IclR family transcriptional regulator [Burkholderia pseudomultivorans]AIO30140.1 bacterial transcriptional regulator family protein [Burkholderia cenocepacia]KVC25014.1 IclR family transcriptional regulator [Burkholderia pseudomultivorans]KVC34832.1 IclR family transcriptional regulator [Burkholderia pseudomultivorans]KVC38217.1 IclR family transcriptional regulator [Burkholderia pseudomultivorans]KWF05417.1 IclR family transcriptional regulator [Burkholderia pseudomultivorans]
MNPDTPDTTGTLSDDETYLVPALERGLRVLELFNAREPVLTPNLIAQRLGLPRTTALRLVQTLHTLGYLERANRDRDYRLGARVMKLGFDYLSSLALTDIGTPVIERLRDETGFASHLVVRDGRDVVFVAKAWTHDSVMSAIKVNIGTRIPAHASVHGHVLLGDLDRAELEALFPEPMLPTYTPHTPRTAAEVHARAQKYAAEGYALSESSFEPGISVISAPVRDGSGLIVAAVTLTVARPFLEKSMLDQGLVGKVLKAAGELSERLNYHAPDPAAARD